MLWCRLQRLQSWGRKKVKPQNENGRSKHVKRSGTEIMLITLVRQKRAEFCFGDRCARGARATFQNLKLCSLWRWSVEPVPFVSQVSGCETKEVSSISFSVWDLLNRYFAADNLTSDYSMFWSESTLVPSCWSRCSVNRTTHWAEGEIKHGLCSHTAGRQGLAPAF